MAGEYWIIHRLTGTTLATRLLCDWVGHVGDDQHRTSDDRLCLVGPSVRALGYHQPGFRIYVVAVATGRTSLIIFSSVVNNHLVVVVLVTVFFYGGVCIVCDGDRRWRYFVMTGTAVEFAATTEFPSLAPFVFFFGHLKQGTLFNTVGLPASFLARGRGFLGNQLSGICQFSDTLHVWQRNGFDRSVVSLPLTMSRSGKVTGLNRSGSIGENHADESMLDACS